MKKKLAILLAPLVLVLGIVLFPSASGASVEHNTWTHRSGHWPTVYVENHITHHVYNLGGAIKAWHSGEREVHKCPRGSHCVRVYSRNLGPNGSLAVTYLCESGGHFCNMKVIMNTYYTYPSRAQYHEAMVHELGHTLGLGHDKSGGVMCACDPGYLKINSYERNELHRIYGIR